MLDAWTLPGLALGVLYSLGLVLLVVHGARVLVITLLYWTVRRRPDVSAVPQEHPHVTVQLPLYNEPFVAGRVLDAACRLRWPRERLEIQVLDDSTDETRSLVDSSARSWRERGVDVRVLRRESRDGFKAGALARGLDTARGELIAVFDADFVPEPDFLERAVSLLKPDVAVVQGRWGHLNRDESRLTQAQALALDGYFLVDQTARSRTGLFLVFNGSAGVWRRAAIEAAGGWQSDTLCEDVDLSYRAQLAGWRILFAPDLVVPAELPSTLVAFKRQQHRWACGTTQALGKLARHVLGARRSAWTRAHAILVLAAHLVHPVSLALFLLAPAVMVVRPELHVVVGLVALAAVSPPLMYAVAAAELHRDWPRRLAVYPLLAALGAGMTLNGTLAVAEAVMRRPTAFERTPKRGTNGHAPESGRLRPPAAGVVAEALLAAYGWLGLIEALRRASPGFALLFALFASGFTLTAVMTARAEPRPAGDRSAPRPQVDGP